MPRGSSVALAVLIAVGCGDVVPDQPPLPWSEDRAIARLVPAESQLALAQGGRATLELQAFYEDLIEPVTISSASWSSSDPTVATLEGSTVTAVAPGRASLYAVVGGVQSAPVSLIVGRGDYDLSADVTVVRRGKLLDITLTSADADFTVATTIDLAIEGLLPFGDARTEDPWWGVVPGTDDEYRGVFLVPPTAPLGDLTVDFLLDGAPPREQVSIEILRNEALDGAPHDCDYFEEDNASNWSFATGTNQARTWLLGGLSADTLSRFATRSTTTGDVDPWMALWSLEGDLLVTNDTVAGAVNTDESAIEVTALTDDFSGGWYLTVSISPDAVSSQAEGTLGTSCVDRDLPPFAAEATDGFPGVGVALTPGRTTKSFAFDGIGGSLARAYVYLDLDVLRPAQTTVRLRAPDDSEVDLIDPDWSEDLGLNGRWMGTVGAPKPFVPGATPGGTTDLAGVTISGTWEIEVDVQTVGELGAWYDAKIWLESQ